MAQQGAERLIWAVETLAVDPADQLLEIGCGHGVAVSLIGERLTTGTITAIDRSRPMIDAAEKRNRAHIASGTAMFQAAALGDADLGDQRFDKIFAVSVGLFLHPPAGDLERVKGLLKPGGSLYVFYQPPTAAKTRQIADRVLGILRRDGFSIMDLRFKDMKPAPATCVIATVA